MKHCIVLIYCLNLASYTWAQNETDSVLIPEKQRTACLQNLQAKATAIDQAMSRSTARSLQKLQDLENRIYKKLRQKDTALAGKFLEDSRGVYAQLNDKLNNPGLKRLKEYIPAFDSLTTTLGFLQQLSAADKIANIPNPLAGQPGILGSCIQSVNEISRLIGQRCNTLTKNFQGLQIDRILKQFNKETSFYQQKVREIKSLLSDRKRAEKKILVLLQRSKRFRDFFAKLSILTEMMKIPSSGNASADLAGLQTIDAVRAMLAARLAPAGVDLQQFHRQQLQASALELDTWKRNLTNIKDGNNSEIPRLNTQKTKPVLKRIEYSANIQLLKRDNFTPIATDIALIAGYKLNDIVVIGLGTSFQLGWGESLDKIKITARGFGLRSLAEVKWKGGLWFTGGYEKNFSKPPPGFTGGAGNLISESALAGFTKKINLGKKGGKLQLLYDFLPSKTKTTNQRILFRLGYNL